MQASLVAHNISCVLYIANYSFIPKRVQYVEWELYENWCMIVNTTARGSAHTLLCLQNADNFLFNCHSTVYTLSAMELNVKSARIYFYPIRAPGA